MPWVPDIRPGGKFTAREIGFVADMIASGGEVDRAGLDAKLADAEILATARSNDIFVGAGALKRLNVEYIEITSKKADYALPSNAREIGYFFTQLAWRKKGIGTTVGNAVLPRDTPVFATTRHDNTDMHPLLEKLGLERNGGTWRSTRRLGVIIELWIRGC